MRVSKSRSSCSVTASSIHFGENQKIPRGKDSLVRPGQQRCALRQHPGGQQPQARGAAPVKLADSASLRPSQGAAWPIPTHDRTPPTCPVRGRWESRVQQEELANRAEEALGKGGEPGCRRCPATPEKRVGKPLSTLCPPNCLSPSISRGLRQRLLGGGPVCVVPCSI